MLTDEQRKVLKDFGIDNNTSIKDEIVTIERLKDGCANPLTDNKKPIITRVRIHNILKKMQKYVIIGDIAVQHDPAIVSLVWAGVRFCLMVSEEIYFAIIENNCANNLL